MNKLLCVIMMIGCFAVSAWGSYEEEDYNNKFWKTQGDTKNLPFLNWRPPSQDVWKVWKNVGWPTDYHSLDSIISISLPLDSLAKKVGYMYYCLEAVKLWKIVDLPRDSPSPTVISAKSLLAEYNQKCVHYLSEENSPHISLAEEEMLKNYLRSLAISTSIPDNFLFFYDLKNGLEAEIRSRDPSKILVILDLDDTTINTIRVYRPPVKNDENDEDEQNYIRQEVRFSIPLNAPLIAFLQNEKIPYIFCTAREPNDDPFTYASLNAIFKIENNAGLAMCEQLRSSIGAPSEASYKEPHREKMIFFMDGHSKKYLSLFFKDYKAEWDHIIVVDDLANHLQDLKEAAEQMFCPDPEKLKWISSFKPDHLNPCGSFYITEAIGKICETRYSKLKDFNQAIKRVLQYCPPLCVLTENTPHSKEITDALDRSIKWTFEKLTEKYWSKLPNNINIEEKE